MTTALLLLAAAAAPALAKGKKKKGPRYLKAVPDRRAYDSLAEVQPGSFAQGSSELKFLVSNREGKPVAWFFNSRRYTSHFTFTREVLREVKTIGEFRKLTYFRRERRYLAAEIVAHDRYVDPKGERGVFTLEFWPADTVDVRQVALAYRLAAKGLPFAKLRYHPSGAGQEQYYAQHRARFAEHGVPVITTNQLFRGRDVMALNPGTAIGTLRVLGRKKAKIPPTFRDVVVYRYAPNDLPHVAGVLTEEPQTPLSHINLVARQNNTPNAYLKRATQDPRVQALAGKLVRLRVTAEGVELTEVTQKEAEKHWAKVRPRRTQRPKRSLLIGKIKPLSKIRFKDRHAFGSKTVSLAELARVRPSVRVPKGFGVPYKLYHRFMQKLGFYDALKELLADPKFTGDVAHRRKALKAFRKRIKKAEVPADIAAQLEAMHAEFPKGRPIRCRSSANNEDLEGFSGAGLYNSYTHRPDEGSITKSIKQVWSSLFTFRAFEERSFWKIDHFRAAMGVLVHPNFDDERANGVAVSKNLLAPKWEGTYVNVQKGELQSITNPLEAQPEEFVVAAIGQFVKKAEMTNPTGNGRERETVYLRRSSLVAPGKTVLTPAQVLELDLGVRAIHKHFAKLCKKTEDKDWALDIEFKIDKAGDLVFKQARPWVD